MPLLQRTPIVFLITVCLLFAACSSSRETGKDTPATADRQPPPAEERQPPESRPPPPEKEPPAPVTRTVQGFRIQILTTDEKAAADRQVDQALSWWRTLPTRDRPAYLGDRALSIDVKWQQPYYRVRLGDFATRSEAQRALNTVKKAFPDAFIIPDLVTITR